MNQMKATMADIARLAKVSPTTAARVIHNNGYVSQETVKRCWKPWRCWDIGPICRPAL